MVLLFYFVNFWSLTSQKHVGWNLLRSWLIFLTQPGHTATLHQKKWLKGRIHPKERTGNRIFCHRVAEFGLQFDLRKPIQKHNYKATGGSGKKQKESRDFMTAEFRSNQAEIKNQLNEMQSGIPGWLSGLVPAFGPGHDSGVPGSSPISGSLHGACFSLCLSLSLS